MQLLVASTCVPTGPTGQWLHWQQPHWVLDAMHHGQQRQAFGKQRPFLRPSGNSYLYAPGVPYAEWRETNNLESSFIIFTLAGRVEEDYRRLVGRAGYHQIQDPDGMLGGRLREISQLLFERRSGFHLRAHGIFLDLLGLILGSQQVGTGERLVTKPDHPGSSSRLSHRVESYIRQHIGETIRVSDLARHVSLSRSALAHAYRRQAGETPRRAITRLKIETAKRLLLQDGLSTKQCAQRLGFATQFHFSRVFKRTEGTSPTHYVALLRRHKRI
ncbi:MAG: helix-turn-helix transcriptional regulator [Phycisphaeraceae bacterium]|nr:helix-turn-helix transcriptional regulator [Phycisphaeraceae bacterium]